MKREDLRLVMIIWRDHAADSNAFNWMPLREIADLPEGTVHSVGWLVKNDKKHKVIIGAIDDNNHGASSQTIMAESALKIIDLVPSRAKRKTRK